MNNIMTPEEVTSALEELQNDPSMNSSSMYSPTATQYPENQLPFVEIHLNYLRKNKHVVASRYIANLKIMIKKR